MVWLPSFPSRMGVRDQTAAVKAVSTTFFVLLALAVLLLGVIFTAGKVVPWASLLNLTQSPVAGEVGSAVIWFLCLQVLTVPALIAQKVQIGYQEMHWTNSWQILGTVLSFAGVLISAKMHLGLTAFIILFSAGPLVAQLIANGVLFFKLRPWLKPRLSAFDRHGAWHLAGTGGSLDCSSFWQFLATRPTRSF